jgi:hypothetical protein
VQPTIGDSVHYVARGSADGKFPKACRAAIVTERDDPGGANADLNRVGLMVANPTGQQFISLAEGGCRQGPRCRDIDDPTAGGTWHWVDRF